MYALGRPGLQFDTKNPVWMPKTNFLALVRDARLAELETRYDDATSVLTISRDTESQLSTDLSQPAGRAALKTFFGTFLSDDISGPPTLLKADGHSFSDLDDKVISLINLESVRAVAAETGRDIDPIRFRGNIWFDGAPAWAEHDWVGCRIKIGDIRLEVIKRTRRCGATNVNPDNALRDENIPATLQKT